MANKNASNTKAASAAVSPESLENISSASDLKTFLLSVRDHMRGPAAAPIYALSAMQYIFGLPQANELLDKDNRELARDIWLRLKQEAMQLRNPPMLFPEEYSGDGKSA